MSQNGNLNLKMISHEYRRPLMVLLTIVEPESQAHEKTKIADDEPAGQTRDKIRAMIDDFAMNLAKLDTDPDNWAGWMNYLFECLEFEAQVRELDEHHPAAIERTFADLRDCLNGRLERGSWLERGGL